VLWSYETTKRILTGETLFLLSYGTKAITPVDIFLPTLRRGKIDRDQIAIQLFLSQDQSEERQQEAQIRIAGYR